MSGTSAVSNVPHRSVVALTSQENQQAPQQAQMKIWTKENEFSSKGQTTTSPAYPVKEIENISSGGWLGGLSSASGTTLELRNPAANILVKGKAGFEAGKGPDSSGSVSGTANHDSFDQGFLYHSFHKLRDAYQKADLGMTFEQMVRAKSGKDYMQATANAMSQTNAFYRPANEQMSFGTSGGKWDLAADADVAVHEAGHYVLDHLAPNLALGNNFSGALHEGYGDAQSALLYRDPDMSEDFGKVRGGPGTALRQANNTLTVSQTGPEPHNRGRVFAGFMWSIGEHLHEALTGAKRDNATDVEPMNDLAADEALKVLWTFPAFLGTKRPESEDVVRSVLKAVDTLEKAGKFDPKVDVAALREFVVAEAQRREMSAANPADNELILDRPSLADAVAAMGLNPDRVRAERVMTTRTADGSTITRYELKGLLMIGSEEKWVDMADDYLTLIQNADGSAIAQPGLLANVPENGQYPGALRFSARGKTSRTSDATLERAASSLRNHARRDLQDRRGLRGLVSDGRTEGTPEFVLTMAQQALQSAEPSLVWKNGTLSTVLEAGPVRYIAPILSSGEIGEAARELTIIVD